MAVRLVFHLECWDLITSYSIQGHSSVIDSSLLDSSRDHFFLQVVSPLRVFRLALFYSGAMLSNSQHC